MSQVFRIKRGDTSPGLRYEIFPKSIILTGATIRFQMEDESQTTVVDAQAQVIQATGNPTVGYAWAPGDTDRAGTYRAEFRITYPDGSVETFPNDKFITVSIGRDIKDIGA